MTHFKVIVPKLNVRRAPVSDFANKSNIITTVGEGFELDLEEVHDVPNPSLGKWFRDSKNQYYSEKGLKEVAVLKTTVTGNDFNLQFDFPAGLKKNKGKGVVVAILDTGLATNARAGFNIVAGYNAITKTENEFEDNVGHGTFVAGLIAANGNNKHGITGIAPDVSLIIVKISDDKMISNNNVAKGLLWLDEVCTIKPDIINISSDFAEGTLANFFAKKFASFANKDAYVFASAGDNAALFNEDILFPAMADNVFAVGSLDPQLSTTGELNKLTDFISGKQNFVSLNSTDPEKTASGNGSSFSTAVASAAMGLAIADFRIRKPNVSKQAYFINQLDKFSTPAFNNSLKIFKI